MFELSLIGPESVAELVSEALVALGALSISVIDADADTLQEQALYGEPGMAVELQGWNRTQISALFVDEASALECLDILRLQDFMHDAQILGLCAVPEKDWVRQTQSQFSTVAITDDFFIVPTWCDRPAMAKTVIVLDPGMAFGTGTHPTTRMCLKWLARHASALGRTLDYGCGSGILGIAAKKLGADHVDALDIDPVAVQSSKDNAQANGVEMRAGLPSLAQGQYRTVLANILATPLQVLAPLLCRHVEINGDLVLAGILSRQADALKEAYAPWVALQVCDEMDGWILMTGRKNQSF